MDCVAKDTMHYMRWYIKEYEQQREDVYCKDK